MVKSHRAIQRCARYCVIVMPKVRRNKDFPQKIGGNYI